MSPTDSAAFPTIALGSSASDLERTAAELLAARVAERAGVTPAIGVDHAGGAGRSIAIGTPETSAAVRSALDEGRAQLEATPGAFAVVASAGSVVVAARDGAGLFAAVGRFLRACSFGDGSWEWPDLHVEATPAKRTKPIYFATHFGNWYVHASDEAIERYVEDLALYGYDTLVTWFDLHHYRDFEDGAPMWDRLGRLDRAARRVGLATARIAIANESFEGQAPEAWSAKGRVPGTGYVTDLCPSIPEARALVLENKRRYFERLRETTEIDWVCLWPYDQGGCNCEACTPWPETFLDLSRDIAAVAEEAYPGLEIAISAWWIGTHVRGEDPSLFRGLERGETWFRTIVTGAVELRRWLADGRRIPDGYEIVLFPEISMFDALPWGGRGANPAPRTFAKEMRDLGPHIEGAVPYSEGRYEDINKFVWAQLQWDASRDPLDIVTEYCRFAFGADVADDAARLIDEAEQTLRTLAGAPERYRQAQALEKRMPAWARDGWRWQVLRARLAIDGLRVEHDDPATTPARRDEVVAELRRVYEHLQHEIHLHDERSLWAWIYLPFDEWMTLPLNELRLPTGA